ncbi:hypothetical protein H072_11428 [Dactylellina haptotyla CBS 200.50]|uniref:F-box domain-containing protein n=1 Tax=Dactylellina haptotyla (strain CBS 200.50) TaxID=1284197 RepID=S7ZXH9_DACHA|nr:hypothetical protein H072_11428 [Dactylellina haptotyla CBS 200.50]
MSAPPSLSDSESWPWGEPVCDEDAANNNNGNIELRRKLRELEIEWNRSVLEKPPTPHAYMFGLRDPNKPKSPCEKLPAELLRPIFEYLRTEDLLTATLTCSSWLAEATPLLYQRFDYTFLIEVHGQIFDLRTYRRVLNQYGVPVNETYSDTAIIYKRYWNLISNTNKGKFVRHVRLLVGQDNKQNFPDIQFYMGRLFANLSTHNLRAIEIGNSSLLDISRFQNLNKLAISVHSLDRGFIELPTLPNLAHIIVAWDLTRLGPTGDNMDFVIAVFCGLVISAPTIRHLEFHSMIYGRPTEVNLNRRISKAVAARSYEARLQLLEKFDNLELPNLEEFGFSDPGHFLRHRIKFLDGSEESFQVFSLFHRFLCRHRDQLKSVKWNAMDSIFDDETSTAFQIPTFRNARSLCLVFPNDLDGQLEDTSFLRYLRKTMDDSEDLENLQLHNAECNEEFTRWAGRDELAMFENVTNLKLTLKVPHGFSLEPNENLVTKLLGGVYNYRDGTYWDFPPFLKKLSINLRNFSAKQDFATSLVTRLDFAILKPKFVNLFHWYKSLKSFKVRIVQTLAAWQGLVMRRLPLQKCALGSDLKKVCIWEVQPIHISNGNGGHLHLEAYDEVVLDEPLLFEEPPYSFTGEDALPWSMNDHCVDAVRQCGAREDPTAGKCRVSLYSKEARSVSYSCSSNFGHSGLTYTRVEDPTTRKPIDSKAEIEHLKRKYLAFARYGVFQPEDFAKINSGEFLLDAPWFQLAYMKAVQEDVLAGWRKKKIPGGKRGDRKKYFFDPGSTWQDDVEFFVAEMVELCENLK